jgi:hypothetical protein
MTEEMSGGLRHHSDEASGPELCGWIQHYRRKIGYVSNQPVPARAKGKLCHKGQKEGSINVDIADVVRDVEKGTKAVISANFNVCVERKFNDLQMKF